MKARMRSPYAAALNSQSASLAPRARNAVDDVQWTISLAYATRRANSIEATKEVLLDAEPKFPKEAAIKYNLACYFCQTGDIQNAKHYLKKAFEIDLNRREA